MGHDLYGTPQDAPSPAEQMPWQDQWSSRGTPPPDKVETWSIRGYFLKAVSFKSKMSLGQIWKQKQNKFSGRKGSKMVMSDSRDRGILAGEHPDHALVAGSDKDSPVPAAAALAKVLLGVCCFYQDLFWKWEFWRLKDPTTSQGYLMIEQLGLQWEAALLQDLLHKMVPWHLA